MPITVSIVEDDTRFRESLSIVINGADGFRCVSSFPNGEVAIAQMPFQWPDIVLMDINLPEMSGIDCAARLKALRPALQIIMITVYMENEKIFKSLTAGASGYLLKKTPPAEILDAIQDVHQGGSPMSSHIARKVVQYIQQQGNSGAQTDQLTDREHEILSHLAEGCQYKEIAEKLSISAMTVRNHLHKIYEKLHVRSRTEAVVKFLNQRRA